jgi:putative drug exporter of the RND superfamily
MTAPSPLPLRRGLVLLTWLLAACVLLPFAVRVEESLEVQARILGSESAAVEDALERRFASPFARSGLLVLRDAPSPETEAGRRVLEVVVAAFGQSAGVTRTFSWLDLHDSYFVGRHDRGTFVVVGLDPAAGRADRLVPGLRRTAADLEKQLATEAPGLRLRLTGEGPLNYDIWRTSTEDVRQAERRTVPLTLVLLVLAFGAVVAALLPVVSGALAVCLSFGIVSLLATVSSLSILAVNVTSMLGLALGIDYALLTVSRYREACVAGDGPAAAARCAATQAGRTVVLSGAPVAIGFLALLLVPLNELRSAAVGGLVVVSVSVLLAATLLPVLLSLLGARVEGGRLRGFDPAARSAVYRRLAAWVVARPALVLVLALPPLLLLAVEARRLSPSIPRGRWLPAAMESAQAEQDLGTMGRKGALHSLRVVLELPPEVQALSRAGWEATRRLAEDLGRDPRVHGVQSLRRLLGDRMTGETSEELAAAAFLPSFVKRTFLSEEGDAVLLEVVPHEDVDNQGQIALVRDLRKADAAARSGLEGARLRIGGLPAFGADYEAAVAGRFVVVVGLVVATTLLALFAGFRSVLVPVKAVLLNLLSVAAAFGALVLVFQDGWGVRLLGLSGPVDGVFPIVPALVFCSVFGLSMDYEVFLVARVREERLAGRSETEAIVEGVARTGPLITSAAAVMIAVFAAFMLGGFVPMKMLGLALAVSVLLDATIIRLVVGPALLQLAGRFNWWPGEGGYESTRPSPPSPASPE